MDNNLIPKPRFRFLKVKCNACSNEQTVFEAAASRVKCLMCSQDLAEPGAGKIRLNAKVIEIYG